MCVLLLGFVWLRVTRAVLCVVSRPGPPRARVAVTAVVRSPGSPIMRGISGCRRNLREVAGIRLDLVRLTRASQLVGPFREMAGNSGK